MTGTLVFQDLTLLGRSTITRDSLNGGCFRSTDFCQPPSMVQAQGSVWDNTASLKLRITQSASATASPYTEAFAPHPQWGGGKCRSALSPPIMSAERPLVVPTSRREAEDVQVAGRDREDDDEIGARLPELREVLEMLREKWAAESGGSEQRRGPGNIFLVGTGPGDAELLTVKALRLIQTADLVLYDRLVSVDILDLVHPGARMLYVGKTSGYHSRTQQEIHELLLNFAEAGASVVRLKGGDPMVFGRGGEEMDFLQEHGIRVQIVPGITAASGISAELGIPLTHRGVANSVRFLTGHSRKGGEDPLQVAQTAVDPDSTLIIYMGLATLPELAQRLLTNGLPASTPAVAVERGTTPEQRVVFSTLDELAASVESARLVSPTLIVIGRVVALSHLWPSHSTSLISDDTCPTFALSEADMSARGSNHLEPRDRRLRLADPILPSQQRL